MKILIIKFLTLMKRYCLLFFLLLFSFIIVAQTDYHSSSGGASFSSSSGNLKMDSVLADILNNASEDTQILDGFNNGLLYISAVETNDSLNDILVFPRNNTADTINISISEKYKYLDFRIYNSEGTILINKRKGAGLNTINIAKLTSGTYYMQILNPKNNEHKTYGLLKK